MTTIQLNASRVMDFDSMALESLVEFDELARSRGLHFVLAAPSDLLSMALSITGLLDRLEIGKGEERLPDGRRRAGTTDAGRALRSTGLVKEEELERG